MKIQIFDKVCLFDTEQNKTIIYGQYIEAFQQIYIDVNVKYNLVFNKSRCDFYIEIYEKITHIDKIIFFYKENIEIVKKDIVLFFPFENCDLSLSSDSAIISTMCKDYSSRLEEWIEYNLHLGFSGIVIFNNDGNAANNINEPLEYRDNNGSISDICNKFKGKVWMVEMKYEPFKEMEWNNLQRITLHIGVNAFQHKCGKIALIDADEFIYLPKYPNITEFFSNYKGQTVTMGSNILTNISNDDIINNNILDLCLYVGENKYTKTIIDTSILEHLEFINTPHEHPSQIILNKDDIIHYHCWVNSRCKYNKNMPRIEFLKDIKIKYKSNH